MMKYEAKSIDVMQTGKLYMIWTAAVGVIIGVVYGFMFGIMATLGLMESIGGGGIAIGLIVGIGSMIAAPILYGIAGFVFGILGAWIYNFIAKKIGGFKFELEQIK